MALTAVAVSSGGVIPEKSDLNIPSWEDQAAQSTEEVDVKEGTVCNRTFTVSKGCPTTIDDIPARPPL